MSDEYMLKDVLDTEKYIVSNMSTALNEASCTEIYNCYFNILKSISNEAKILFNIGYNKSWYALEKAPITKVKSEYDKLSKEIKLP